MTFHEFAIPILSIIVPVCVLFVARGLDKGEKKRERMHIDFEQLENRVNTIEKDLNRLLGRMNSHK